MSATHPERAARRSSPPEQNPRWARIILNVGRWAFIVEFGSLVFLGLLRFRLDATTQLVANYVLTASGLVLLPLLLAAFYINSRSIWRWPYALGLRLLALGLSGLVLVGWILVDLYVKLDLRFPLPVPPAVHVVVLVAAAMSAALLLLVLIPMDLVRRIRHARESSTQP